MNKLPKTGTLLARVEAPTMRYRVTSVHGAYARLLPFRRQGREVLVAMAGAVIVGDGSVWHATGEVA